VVAGDRVGCAFRTLFKHASPFNELLGIGHRTLRRSVDLLVT